MKQQYAEATDEDLVRLVRSGETAAFGVLWKRHYMVISRLALRLTNDPDDVVSEAFLRTFNALQRGQGPTTGFRSYVIRTCRNLALNATRNTRAFAWDTSALESLGVCNDDDQGRRIDALLAVKALAALPHRWQEVIWLRDVKNIPPRVIAERTGARVGDVSALVYRAHEGLRQEWIRVHLRTNSTRSPECRTALSHLPAFVRNNLPGRRSMTVCEHLQRCSECALQAEEAVRVNRLIHQRRARESSVTSSYVTVRPRLSVVPALCCV